ncbi:MAG: PH domain-containing protein [Dehalococcoidia bacterium]
MVNDATSEGTSAELTQAEASSPAPVSPLPTAHSPLPPLGPCRVHPAWIAIGAVGWLRGLGLPFLIALVTGGSRYAQIFYAVASVLAVAITIVRIIEWTRIRYEVSGGELRVTSGLFARQERLVPLERIQAVDISENLLQRLFGVVGVKIETAAGGSSASEVSLAALRRPDAIALRDRLAVARPAVATDAELAAAREGAGAAAPSAGGSHLIRAITPMEVVIAGATSARVGPALAIVITGLELFDSLFGRTIGDLLGIERGVTVTGAAVLIALFAVGSWLLAIAGAALVYSGFELRRDGDRLLIHHGLLDRRRRTIPIARIQAIHISEGLLRQPFGLASVQFDSAGYGRASADTGLLFPLLPASQVADLLTAACPALAVQPGQIQFNRPPARARRRYILPLIWVTLAIAAAAIALSVWASATPWWGAPFLLLVPPAALLGMWQYRDAGWAIDANDRLIVRGRAFGRSTAITLRRRLQHYSVHRTFFQRPAHLATFGAAIASGGRGRVVSVAHLDEGIAFAIADPTPDPSPR